MPREITSSKQVALLATGDEIIQGDIQNTNSQQIAVRLTNQNIQIGMHMSTGDNIDTIMHAMEFLLASHKGLIITGGLGPTSDDLTRFALSKLINHPLIFDHSIWEYICQRLKRFGYPTPPESNRQQALFPEGATIIPNPNGTAAGCWLQFNDKYIFMLPGPPDECLSMIDSVVLPTLLKNNYQQILYREKWLLFGASEGKIAEELDKIAKPFNCITGYRLCYPYLEFKLLSSDQQALAELIPLIEEAIKPHLIGNGKQTASEQIKPLLEKMNGRLGICDLATGGLLESIITTPATTSHVLFSKQGSDFQAMNYIEISGLEEFWQDKKDASKTQLKLVTHIENKTQTTETVMPLRGDRVKLYAVEWVCQQMINHKIIG